MHPYKAQPTGTSPGLVNASGVGINAYGVVVRGGGLYEMDFWFIGVQIEDSSSSRTTKATPPSTCRLDGTTFCEVRGTAVFAPNGPGLKVPPGVFLT
jgi:hypothetical protein